MFCKYCGHQVQDNSIFCSQCGQRLEDSAPTAEKSVPESTELHQTLSEYNWALIFEIVTMVTTVLLLLFAPIFSVSLFYDEIGVSFLDLLNKNKMDTLREIDKYRALFIPIDSGMGFAVFLSTVIGIAGLIMIITIPAFIYHLLKETAGVYRLGKIFSFSSIGASLSGIIMLSVFSYVSIGFSPFAILIMNAISFFWLRYDWKTRAKYRYA